MNSKLLTEEGFDEWINFSLDNYEYVIEATPKLVGVYVIRYSGGLFGRFNGESDILYIGKSENKRKFLKGEISSYFKPGPTQTTRQRIRKYLDMKIPMEIAYKCIERPRYQEKDMLTKYEIEHWELPPFNRSS